MATQLRYTARFPVARHAKPKVETSLSAFAPDENDARQACAPPPPATAETEVPLPADGVLAGCELDTWADARARLRELFRRATSWRDELVRDPRVTMAALAERDGVSGAYVSRTTGLLRLPPSVLLDLIGPGAVSPVPKVDVLNRLARLRDPAVQSARFHEIQRELAAGGARARAQMARQAGFQHLLSKARRYHAWLSDGQHRSLRSIAEAEGITDDRVATLLDLLTLPPTVLAAIDVPPEKAPPVTQADLRALARLSDAQTQIRRFEQLRSALAPR